LRVYYDTPHGPVKAVDGVTFELRAGERMGLIGESGSGKTTLAIGIMRLVRPPARIAGGRVLLGERDVMALSEAELRRVRLKELALVPQAAMNSLNPVMRVGNQLSDAILAHEPSLGRGELRARIESALDQVGLPRVVAGRYPHQLSGGMKQRAAMAIAISLKPKVIIADEPTSALDVTVQAEVLELLRELRSRDGMSVLFISHDLAVIAELCDRVAVMRAGSIVEQGPTDQIMSAPQHPYTVDLLRSVPAIERRA
jgi:peptide/nickel transport system ATP-binding protein